MRLFLLGAFSAIMAPIVIAILVLLSVPDLRHAVFRMAIEMPGFAYFYLVRRQVLGFHFERANVLLSRQLALVDDFAPTPNTLLPGLIQNATFAIEQAKFKADMAALRPFLENLVKSQPKLLRARLWLARALKENNPVQALKHLEAAARLVPSDERTYRFAIEIAAREKNADALADWCGRFQTAQLGGTHPYWSNPRIKGGGLRRLSIEVVDTKGEAQVIHNSGLQLGKVRTYSFALEKPAGISELTLHLGVIPGIQVSVRDLRFLHQGRKRVIERNNLLITARTGFFLENGNVLTVSREGESIIFIPPEDGFGQADRIELTLGFGRMPVAGAAFCGSGKK